MPIWVSGGMYGGGGVLCLPLIPPLSYVSLYTLYQMSLYAYSITVISGWRCPIIHYVNASHAPTSLVQYLCSLFSVPLIWIHGTPWQTFAPRHQLNCILMQHDVKIYTFMPPLPSWFSSIRCRLRAKRICSCILQRNFLMRASSLSCFVAHSFQLNRLITNVTLSFLILFNRHVSRWDP